MGGGATRFEMPVANNGVNGLTAAGTPATAAAGVPGTGGAGGGIMLTRDVVAPCTAWMMPGVSRSAADTAIGGPNGAGGAPATTGAATAAGGAPGTGGVTARTELAAGRDGIGDDGGATTPAKVSIGVGGVAVRIPRLRWRQKPRARGPGFGSRVFDASSRVPRRWRSRLTHGHTT
jgi:hypothetical protein